MRIFITGASGFIGRSVCAATAGHECLALDLAVPVWPAPHVKLLVGDLFRINDYRAEIEAFKPQVCIHLAWAGLPDYSLANSRRNFEAGLDVLDLMLRVGCHRAVVTGTCWEYGAVSGCVSEDRQPEKPGLFAAFKSAQRLVAMSMYADAGAALLWARPFFVYGAMQRPTSLLPSVYKALSEGRVPEIRSPLAINDFIHVDDVASGLTALAGGGGASGIYNLGSAEPTRVRDAVNLLARAMDKADVYPASNEPGSGFWADQSRLARDYNWRPAISLHEGIARTVDHWKANS